MVRVRKTGKYKYTLDVVLDENTLYMIEKIAKLYGLSKSATVRLAVRKLANDLGLKEDVIER